MRMYDLITKKKRGQKLSGDEISAMINDYVKGVIPDYQMSAFLMAVCLKGMDAEETFALTKAMAASGDTVDLSPLAGKKVDKHSTGGIGDKTTLIATPTAAACNVVVAKMSGRALGHTGGTIDKLESIKGFRTELTRDEFFSVVEECSLSIIGQSGNLVPADKKLYALRDVTATVDSIPLIASSIMSKKLAAGNDAILLDVKTGSGAFMEKFEDALELAKTMTAIGAAAGKNTVALITDMSEPLGRAVGNSLEVMEAAAMMNGCGGAKDLREVSLALATNMIYLARKENAGEEKEFRPFDMGICYEMAKHALSFGRAFEKFCQMVKLQGGDEAMIRDLDKFPYAPCMLDIKADRAGYLGKFDAKTVGEAAALLGTGRETKDSEIDLTAGIFFHYKSGEAIMYGTPIVRLYASDEHKLKRAADVIKTTISVSSHEPPKRKMILARVTKNGVQHFVEQTNESGEVESD